MPPSSLTIKTRCRHYRGNVPCLFHKRDGRGCEGCANYDEVVTRILIIKLGAIGDVLRTTSILPALRKRYIGAEITWITRANAVPLIDNNPFLDRVLAVEDGAVEHLHAEEFSIGMCLDCDSYSGVLQRLAHCREKLGFISDEYGRVHPANQAARYWWEMSLNDTLKRRNRKTYHEILYETCGVFSPIAPPQLRLHDKAVLMAKAFRESSPLLKARRIIGINTGASDRWEGKKWPIEYYVDCIQTLKRHRDDASVLLLGGPREADVNRRIVSAVGKLVVDAGCDHSLCDFAALVNLVDVLLTPDSLAMHIGVALSKKVVVLVGATSPWELDVFGKGRVLSSSVECLACYREVCDARLRCMKELTPELVAGEIMRHLD